MEPTRREPGQGRAGRVLVVPALLIGAALAFVIGVDPGRAWTGDAAPVRIAATLVCVALAATAAVRWQGEREAARVRRALAAGIFHPLRTPLAQIRMFTEMLLMGRERSEEERIAWLETIEREAHRLGDVMENLLLFVHGDEPDPFPARQRTDLGALVEDVATGFASRAAARRMRIDADPPAGIVATVDPQAVRQAVGNLIDNAIRFGTPGQTIAVSLEAGAAGRAVVVVSDEGPGIPPEARDRVWKPFVRLVDDTAGLDGSGIGLAVVRRVAEAHGGQTSVSDAPGGGARFAMSLPAQASRTAAAMPLQRTAG